LPVDRVAALLLRRLSECHTPCILCRSIDLGPLIRIIENVPASLPADRTAKPGRLEDRYQAPVDVGHAEREVADRMLMEGLKPECRSSR